MSWGMRSLVTMEGESPEADVLVVTSGWPTAEHPARGIFIARQMESLRRLGIRYETLYVRGYRSRWAYVVAAGRLLSWNFTRGRKYRLVHCHGGEAALAAAFYRRAPLLVSYLGSDLLGAPDAVAKISRANRIRR